MKKLSIILLIVMLSLISCGKSESKIVIDADSTKVKLMDSTVVADSSKVDSTKVK